MTSPEDLEDRVLVELLTTLAAEREAGRERTLEWYLERFPGHESVVRREYGMLRDSSPADHRCIGRFRLLRELGRGGQGVVYLAQDERLQRPVALKVLAPGSARSDGGLPLRLRREVHAIARLDHPGICAVHDAGEDDGHVWVAMRYVEGKSLAQHLAIGRVGEQTLHLPGRTPPTRPQAPFSVSDAMAFVEKVARAVHVAHEAGVTHRDLKPANIMVTPHGDPVVLDFGLARAEDDTLPTLTRTGDLVGTPAYMAPERLQGGRGEHPSSDVWSLGVTLYEMVTGRPPFAATDLEGVVRMVLGAEPPDPRALVRAIPRDLAVVMAAALEKAPQRRYGSALELAEDLRRIQAREPIRARAIGRIGRGVRWVRRNPLVAALGCVLFLAAVGGVTAAFVFQNLAERERDSRDRLAEEKSRVVAADEQSRRLLVRSLLDQARMLLASDRRGRRWQALDILRRAVTERAKATGGELPSLTDLRSAAITALVLGDIRQVCATQSELLFTGNLDSQGRFAASPWAGIATRERGLRIYGVDSAQEIRRLTDPDLCLGVLAVAPGGTRVIGWNKGRETVIVRDLETGRSDVAWRPDATIRMMDLDHTGRWLAMATRTRPDGSASVMLWDSSGERLRELHRGPSGDAWASFASGSGLLAYAAGTTKVAFADVASEQPPTVVDVGETVAAAAIGLTGDGGRRLCAISTTAGGGHAVRMFDGGGGLLRVVPLPLGPGPSGRAALDAAGARFAYGTRDGRLVVVTLDSEDAPQVFPGTQRAGLDAMRWRDDGNLAVIGRADALRVWEVAKPSEYVRTWKLQDVGDGRPPAVTVSGDGRRFAVPDPLEPSNVLLYEGRGPSEPMPLEGRARLRHGSRVVLRFSDDGKRLLRVSQRAVEVFDLEADELRVLRPPGALDPVDAAFDDRGRIVVTGRGGALAMREDDDGAFESLVEADGLWAGYAGPRGNHVVAVSHGVDAPGAIRVHDLRDGSSRQLPGLESAYVRGVTATVDPTGRWLAVPIVPVAAGVPAGGARRVRVLEFETLREHGAIELPVGLLEVPLSFSDDGRILAVANGNELQLWDVALMTRLLTIKAHPVSITQVLWPDQTDLLVTVDEAGRIKRWEIGRLLAELAALGLGI